MFIEQVNEWLKVLLWEHQECKSRGGVLANRIPWMWRAAKNRTFWVHFGPNSCFTGPSLSARSLPSSPGIHSRSRWWHWLILECEVWGEADQGLAVDEATCCGCYSLPLIPMASAQGLPSPTSSCPLWPRLMITQAPFFSPLQGLGESLFVALFHSATSPEGLSQQRGRCSSSHPLPNPGHSLWSETRLSAQGLPLWTECFLSFTPLSL